MPVVDKDGNPIPSMKIPDYSYKYRMMHQVYIGGKCLPQTPAKITISNQNHNEEFMMANGRPFTCPRWDGAQKFEFDFEITMDEYPFTIKGVNRQVRWWTDYLWQIKQNKRPISLEILRRDPYPDTYVMVLLDDYSYVEDAENKSDYIFSVSFTEYNEQNNQEQDAGIQHHLLVAREARSWIGEVDEEAIAEEKRIEQAKQAAAASNAANAESRLSGGGSVGAVDGSKAARIIQVANSQMGNGNKYGSGAWCAWFCKWCAEQVGAWWPNGTGYCPNVSDSAKSAGRWTQIPQPGFYVLFDWDGNGRPDHIGIVSEVISSNHVKTIEGNHGNRVAAVDRSSRIMGYVNPF